MSILPTTSGPLDFWFEFGSTYSYLCASRIEDVAAASGVSISWEPFLLGPIFKEQGWDDSTFNIYPAKGRYMWRDVERLCERYEIPFVQPSRFPRSGVLASRVACLAASEPWGAAAHARPAPPRSPFGRRGEPGQAFSTAPSGTAPSVT